MTEETIVTKADALDAKSETYTQIRTNIPVFLNTDISHLQGIYFSLKLSLYALNAVFCDVFVMKNAKGVSHTTHSPLPAVSGNTNRKNQKPHKD